MRSCTLLMAAFAALGVLGCASGLGEAGGGAVPDELGVEGGGGSASVAAPPMPELPRYSVPVDSAELAPWSRYQLAMSRGWVQKGVLRFRYPFPAFINGAQEFVMLEGPFVAGQTHVEVSAGALGRGTCDLADGIWSCFEQLPGLTVDASLAHSTMQAAGVLPAEIEKRLQVTASFSVDPIGIFEMSAQRIEFLADDVVVEPPQHHQTDTTY